MGLDVQEGEIAIHKALYAPIVRLFREKECNTFFFTPEPRRMAGGLQMGGVTYPEVGLEDEDADEDTKFYILGVKLSRYGKFSFVVLDMMEDPSKENVDFITEGNLPVGFAQIGNDWLSNHDLGLVDSIPMVTSPLLGLVGALMLVPPKTLVTFPQQNLFDQQHVG